MRHTRRCTLNPEETTYQDPQPEEPVPDWVEEMEKLQEEAEELYPDGRLSFITPSRKKQRRRK
jgi:hypothetical protein